jgi:GNAT superfamily N-acetyltransferase
VKADWQALSNQANRTILCLRAKTEIVGFVTGFIDDNKFGYVDGVYVAPKWRRQYWGTALLDAIHDQLTSDGATEVRITVKTGENRTRFFLHNLFWRTGIHVLIREETEQTFKTAISSLFRELKKEKVGEYELEIPRNML